MFISDVTRLRNTAFEAAMVDFKEIIFNDDVARALDSNSVHSQEYKNLFERFVPATVRHRTVGLSGADIKAGRIGIAFLTDEEADGYNIHPRLATSMLPEQSAILQEKSGEMIIRSLLKIRDYYSVSVANILDPNNSSGYTGLYKKLDDNLAVAEARTAYWPSRTSNNFWTLGWLYPTIVTSIRSSSQSRIGLTILHEATHVLQAMRSSSTVPTQDLEAHVEANAVFRELEAYSSEGTTARALGAENGTLPLVIKDLIEDTGLSVQGNYEEFDRYSGIEGAINEYFGDQLWHGFNPQPFKSRDIPELAKKRLTEIIMFSHFFGQEIIRVQLNHLARATVKIT